MAYQNTGRKFGRKQGQRRQLMRSLARSIILHKRIATTEARAKSLRPYIEKLVTRSANNDLITRRMILARFNNDKAVAKNLLDELGPKYKDRKGGYTRVIKVEPRQGSGRTAAVIEFV